MSKNEFRELVYEIRYMWKKSSKIEKAATVIFILSLLFIVMPFELLSDVGNIMQVIFWILFIYIIADRSQKNI